MQLQVHLNALDARRGYYRSQLPAGKAAIVKEGGSTLHSVRVLLPNLDDQDTLARIVRPQVSDGRAGLRNQPAYRMRDVSA